MPYDTFKVGSPGKQYCVFKVDAQGTRTGDRLGCHPTRQRAALQIAAIEANERDKDMTDEKEVKNTESEVVSVVPADAVSFGQVEEFQTSVYTSERVGEISRQFETLSKNIMSNPEVPDKGKAHNELVEEYLARVEHTIEQGREPSFLESLFRKSGLRPVEKKEPENKAHNGFMIWKEGDVTRWLTIYSNKYRDRDNPPEILSEKSHEDFIARVDAKEVAYPELWLWHIPGTRIGVADWLSFDKENGFALASGVIDKEAETVAENLAEMETLVSHGMPVESIERDEEDETIITRYVSKEISILPDYAAANLHTDFVVLKEQSMSIPEEKLDFLKKAGISDAQITEINAALDSKGKEADGLEFKEAEKPKIDLVEELVEEIVEEDEEAKLSMEGLAEEMVKALTPIAEQVKANAEAIQKLARTDEEKIKEVAAATPNYSLSELVLRGLRSGESNATVVLDTDELAKSKPKETDPDEKKGPTSIPFINQIIEE